MRLKSLEIKGFKSFADKTIVNFDEGITGIIGPNGCGKSNIIDSIRWVIGEQKISSLRSENLDALVFNGSKTRSPSGLAEVSLTFENTRNLLPTEFSTVTVTRRFYKNGDSEYRLNDVACRLKDIHNLFLDTGVSNDSYAIIELGMVDDIIKDKDNSRRRMLEQAAGITIYKTRKKEAKSKLDATEQDLARIEDLLFEIHNQLKSLESQAKKAEKYYEIKKEYKIIAVELAKASLEGFNLTYKNLQEQQELETDKKIRLEAEIANQEAVLEQEKIGFIEKERALQSMQYQFNELVQQLRTKENDKNLASQKLVFLKEKETNLKHFLQNAEGQLKGIDESLAFSKVQIKDEENKLADMHANLENLKYEVELKRQIFDEKRAGVDQLRQQYQQLQRSQFDAEKKVAIADTSIQNLQRSQMQLTTEQKNREAQLQQLTIELTQKEQTLAEKRTHLQQMQEQHEKTKQQILETQQELEVLRNQLADESRKLDARKNEYNLLKSLIDSMEGYPESIKFLHKNPEWDNQAPILSDIIYVKEAYRAAVENVLEPYLNYFVVNNLEEGLQAVRLLDKHQKGKANFFMLDKFQHYSTGIAQPAQTIAAMDIIEVDDQYRPLAAYLLGHVFIAESEVLMEQDIFSDAIILEKSGKIVKGKYTLTGGSVGLFEGKKIGRAKNLEKLEEKIQEQEAVVNLLKADIQHNHQKVVGFNEQLKEQTIRATENEINQLINQVFAAKNKIENITASQQQTQLRIEEIEQRMQDEQDSIAETRLTLAQLNEQLKALGNEMAMIEQDYQLAEQDYNLTNIQFNEFNLQLTRQQSKINAIQQELQFKKNQLNDLQKQIENNTRQLAEAATQIEDGKLTVEIIEEELILLMKQKETEEKQLNEADQAYYNLRNILQEKENDVRQKNKQREMAEHLLAEIKDKLNELKLQLAGMKERLNVEFKISLEEILEQSRTTEMPLEELQATSDKMRKRMENIGEVNPTAIEAYQEMKKRYEFIVEQKNDLVQAKESLLQTIQEVEATANQQFLDTFNKVRDNFQKVFKALFSEEDTCDMVLENPENLAETGIEIMAKPKGKRPSSITQLSGGEKTLTATALLFAIYLIKPAPFCIMDEVDAPLDDANVTKFTQMIKKFSENSQFILITHNKQTMSAVDVIYGVTMQEPGVSKLVPVDFRSLN
ncbi:MAG: chromosome segregation protein SMC [Hydrotalea flava]|uniref:chromosome segregation protein SMC n=2 Tax=Chitinophagaceae TaxID=563835 RepID=UPI0010266753|nr:MULTISPECIES: chromosome segregation protein SMC [Hydrotalea]MBY0346809.1 chromosome segregation protein SMC [Hydrotalea flava]RWZ89724.1 MAG: chromosome segregation protein SMC [Hydrotalea sp. AMD]